MDLKFPVLSDEEASELEASKKSLEGKTTRTVKTDELADFHQPIDDENDDNQQQISLLYKVIKMLGDIDRAIVMMYLDDVPYKDIAENIGITEVNARVKMNRLKKTLKDLMTQHAE
ncbi:hypothetical protein FQR65_LT15291 [Abscondita terminalis]|nr:hypothetical protein FQR65_LT15291 [Abscondita terminalis]